MGQKQSKSEVLRRYLSPLPEYYEKSELPEVYSLRNENHTCIQSTNPQIPHPETIGSKEKCEQLETIESKTVHSDKSSYSEGLPSHLRHFVIILNDFETKNYLNHLVYRNQPEFRDFIVQIPFGEIEKNEKYTKIHLYVEEVALTLNHISNLPFHDMCMILYTSLIAYKYLYSYFGLFKIEENMIGFTRDSKVKVWLNHKLTKDKPLPIVSDINLKRYKEEENYMVDDLMIIFWNKVDKETVPKNFNLINKFSSIRNSRHIPSRLSLSRIENKNEMSKSMVHSLENNLVDDFSEGSFDKCLEYLETFLNIKRPSFLKIEASENPEVQVAQKSIEKESPMINSRPQPYKNFIPAIEHMIRYSKELSRESTDLRSSTGNFNINFRDMFESLYKPEINRKEFSRYNSSLNFQTFNAENQSYCNRNSTLGQSVNEKTFGLVEESICRPIDMQNSRPTSFNLPVESNIDMRDSLCKPFKIQNEESLPNNNLTTNSKNAQEKSKFGPSQLENSTLSRSKSEKISMRIMMQPVLNSSATPYESVQNSYYAQTYQPQTSMSFSKKYPVSNQSMAYMNGTQFNSNMVDSKVKPYNFGNVEESQRVNQSTDFHVQNYQTQMPQKINNQNTIINRIVKI